MFALGYFKGYNAAEGIALKTDLLCEMVGKF